MYDDEDVLPTSRVLCLSVCICIGVGAVDVLLVTSVLCNPSLLLCQENLLYNILIQPLPYSTCVIPLLEV